MQKFSVKGVPLIRLVEGEPTIKFWFSDCGPLEEPVVQFIEALQNSSSESFEEVGIEILCPIKELIDMKIDLCRVMAYQEEIVMDVKDKEDFLASKKALLDCVAKIDSIKFVDKWGEL